LVYLLLGAKYGFVQMLGGISKRLGSTQKGGYNIAITLNGLTSQRK
jgi:hypothetical protein